MKKRVMFLIAIWVFGFIGGFGVRGILYKHVDVNQYDNAVGYYPVKAIIGSRIATDSIHTNTAMWPRATDSMHIDSVILIDIGQSNKPVGR